MIPSIYNPLCLKNVAELIFTDCKFLREILLVHTIFIHTKAPSLLIAPPPPLNLCKVHILGFYIPLNNQHLCDSGILKKNAF